MADIEGTPTKQDFPEVKGKTVNSVEVSAESEGLVIIIRFQDESTLHFDIEPHIVVTPVYAQWKNGEEIPVKRWKPVQSI